MCVLPAGLGLLTLTLTRRAAAFSVDQPPHVLLAASAVAVLQTAVAAAASEAGGGGSAVEPLVPITAVTMQRAAGAAGTSGVVVHVPPGSVVHMVRSLERGARIVAAQSAGDRVVLQVRCWLVEHVCDSGTVAQHCACVRVSCRCRAVTWRVCSHAASRWPLCAGSSVRASWAGPLTSCVGSASVRSGARWAAPSASPPPLLCPDLNLLHDHHPGTFLQHARTLVRQVPDPEWLNVLLSALHAEDVTFDGELPVHALIPEALTGVGAVPGKFPHPPWEPRGPALAAADVGAGEAPEAEGGTAAQKVEQCCDALIHALDAAVEEETGVDGGQLVARALAQEDAGAARGAFPRSPRLLPALLTAHARKGEREHALLRVYAVASPPDRARALDFLAVLLDVDKLFDDALGARSAVCSPHLGAHVRLVRVRDRHVRFCAGAHGGPTIPEGPSGVPPLLGSARGPGAGALADGCAVSCRSAHGIACGRWCVATRLTCT